MDEGNYRLEVMASDMNYLQRCIEFCGKNFPKDFSHDMKAVPCVNSKNEAVFLLNFYFKNKDDVLKFKLSADSRLEVR